MTWDYSLLCTESRHSRSPYLLTVVTDGGAIVAAVLAMLCRPGSATGPGPVGGVARWGPRWLEVQHAWLSSYPAWLFAEDVDPAGQREILRRFERAVCRFAGPGCLGVVYRAVAPDATGLVSGRGRLRPGDPADAGAGEHLHRPRRLARDAEPQPPVEPARPDPQDRRRPRADRPRRRPPATTSTAPNWPRCCTRTARPRAR